MSQVLTFGTSVNLHVFCWSNEHSPCAHPFWRRDLTTYLGGAARSSWCGRRRNVMEHFESLMVQLSASPTPPCLPRVVGVEGFMLQHGRTSPDTCIHSPPNKDSTLFDFEISNLARRTLASSTQTDQFQALPLGKPIFKIMDQCTLT